MTDFPYSCEILVRKIFQCERFDDPIGRLSNADNWLFANEFDLSFKCKAWAVISRLQNEYLDSIKGREEMYEKSENIEERILSATSTSELRNLMLEIEKLVEKLDLSEFPKLNYKNTNDLKK